jgi:hypothetical protein
METTLFFSIAEHSSAGIELPFREKRSIGTLEDQQSDSKRAVRDKPRHEIMRQRTLVLQCKVGS